MLDMYTRTQLDHMHQLASGLRSGSAFRDNGYSQHNDTCYFITLYHVKFIDKIVNFVDVLYMEFTFLLIFMLRDCHVDKKSKYDIF